MLASPAARLPLAATSALAAGALVALEQPAWAHWFWFAALVLTGLPVAWRTFRGILRGHFAADVVAMLAIVTAIALRQPIAGLVIVIMQTGGEMLERYAEGRASEAVRELEAAAPRLAHRARGDATEDVAAEAVVIGDILLVRPGEMVPCDGILIEGNSHVEVARLTGEPSPQHVIEGSIVRSGAVNVESAFRLRVTAPSRESLYAKIVELVRTAQAEKSPIQRLADRYAVWFTPVTLAACGIAWLAAGDPLRVLAVLVVATPCPLILATPVAIVGGINRAARHQIVVRTGGALEQIGAVDAAVFDKTGTLTIGYPEVSHVLPLAPFDERTLLALAAAVEHHSGHLLAITTVDAAESLGIAVPAAQSVVETPGNGVTGTAAGRRVSVGTLSYVAAQQPTASAALIELRESGRGLRAYVAVDGTAAGVIAYADRTRDGLPAFFAELKALGVSRTLLLSGDHEQNVAALARDLGITEARGDLLPADKVQVVKGLLAEGHRVLMTGDGTNDAPALSAATVGIALAAHGGGITAESAGIVLLADDVTRVTTAIRIGRRATFIAKQSILAGLGLSSIAMVAAALGHIPPTIGALVQEAIDVAVILNALRAGPAGEP
ncbi:MAG TPA: heavy metal translocating P-type ATPase [Gemmatimonadaceae bacterium]|nr:heavy metal translocating P-type ATPase [Gemmatimonadaceae bacterium]